MSGVEARRSTNEEAVISSPPTLSLTNFETEEGNWLNSNKETGRFSHIRRQRVVRIEINPFRLSISDLGTLNERQQL